MKKLFYRAVFAIFLIPQIAFADFGLDMVENVTAFDQINNSFSASVAFMHLHYMEDLLEASPDCSGNIKDVGMVYGVNVNIKNMFWRKLYTEFNGEYVTGKTKYDGYKLDCVTAIVRRKDSNIVTLDSKLGVALLDYENFQIIPYGSFGFRYWKTGESYSYYNFKALGGVKLNIALTDDFILSPYAGLGTTLGSHATAKNPGATRKYKLGNKPIKEAGLEINYRLDREIFLTSGVSYTTFEYGKDEHGTDVEPNSRTNEIRLNIGVKFSFR